MHPMKKVMGVLPLALVLLAGAAAAQAPADPRGLQMSRGELEAVLAEYEQAASSPGYSRSVRERARLEAELIQRRLQEGDFQVGDRIILRVRGERSLPDTLVVEPGPAVVLPEIGTIPLDGVLRSELQQHMTEQLSRYIQNPVVTTEALVRVAILGAVGRPGFFVLPASMLLEDAIMRAGGPGPNTDLSRLRIERGQRVLWEGETLREAMVEGRTLDQLSLRAGDQIQVPERRPGFFEGGVLRTLLITVPPLIYLATRFL